MRSIYRVQAAHKKLFSGQTATSITALKLHARALLGSSTQVVGWAAIGLRWSFFSSPSSYPNPLIRGRIGLPKFKCVKSCHFLSNLIFILFIVIYFVMNSFLLIFFYFIPYHLISFNFYIKFSPCSFYCYFLLYS